jgi:hypothetical protein
LWCVSAAEEFGEILYFLRNGRSGTAFERCRLSDPIRLTREWSCRPTTPTEKLELFSSRVPFRAPVRFEHQPEAVFKSKSGKHSAPPLVFISSRPPVTQNW